MLAKLRELLRKIKRDFSDPVQKEYLELINEIISDLEDISYVLDQLDDKINSKTEKSWLNSSNVIKTWYAGMKILKQKVKFLL